MKQSKSYIIMNPDMEKTQAEKLGFNDIAIWRNTAAPFQYMHCK